MMSTTVTIVSTSQVSYHGGRRSGPRDEVSQLTSRLQASATNEESINVTLFGKILTVLLANAASVDDASLFGGF